MILPWILLLVLVYVNGEYNCEDVIPRRRSRARIFNATLAKPKEFSYMAVLGYENEDSTEWRCGGALISRQHILTAAHCLARVKPIVVRLGDLDLSTSDDDADPKDYEIKNITIFDGYKPPAKYNDIAVIELKHPVVLSKYVSIACLDTSRNHDETAFIVMGWGKTQFSGSESPQLLKANVSPVGTEECGKCYGSGNVALSQGVIDDLQICAGGDSDTCSGDSGGPMVIENSRLSKRFNRKIYDIVGITSFGRACGITKDPGVYTRVQQYLPWIESIIKR